MNPFLKIQCPACKEIVEMRDFSTSNDGLRFTCPACQRAHFLASPEQGRSIAPPTDRAPAAIAQASEIICPKCGHGQTDTVACHRCGLMFAKWDPARQPAPPEQAERLWADIERNPQDVSLHEAFVQACNVASRLEFATRQYRLFEKRADMRPIVERMQERIFNLAQAQITPMNHDNPRAEKRRWLARIVLWVMLAAAIAAFAFLLMEQANLTGR